MLISDRVISISAICYHLSERSFETRLPDNQGCFPRLTNHFLRENQSWGEGHREELNSWMKQFMVPKGNYNSLPELLFN